MARKIKLKNGYKWCFWTRLPWAQTSLMLVSNKRVKKRVGRMRGKWEKAVRVSVIAQCWNITPLHGSKFGFKCSDITAARRKYTAMRRHCARNKQPLQTVSQNTHEFYKGEREVSCDMSWRHQTKYVGLSMFLKLFLYVPPSLAWIIGILLCYWAMVAHSINRLNSWQ